MMVTGSDLTESKNAIKLAEEFPGLCYATVGVHPCSAKSFLDYPEGPEKLLEELRLLAQTSRDAGTATAFGEIGLDYDRLHYCDKETQLLYFAKQLDLAIDLQMPLFLHSRAAASDFEALLLERLDRLPKRGVVHSFTGTLDEMHRIVAMGFDVGINGCSMTTEENIAVVREVPLERLQIETDGPWCDMRPSHASAKFSLDAPELPKAVKKEKWSADCMVKGRNEPCAIGRVAWAVAGIKGVGVEVVCEQWVMHDEGALWLVYADCFIVLGPTQYACLGLESRRFECAVRTALLGSNIITGPESHRCTSASQSSSIDSGNQCFPVHTKLCEESVIQSSSIMTRSEIVGVELMRTRPSSPSSS